MGKNKKKQIKNKQSGQFDLYNYKLAEVAQEIDKINLNELTPIDALNTLVRIKEKIKSSFLVVFGTESKITIQKNNGNK